MFSLRFTAMIALIGLVWLIGSAGADVFPEASRVPAVDSTKHAPKVSKQIDKVDDVKLALDKESGKLVITAVGEVPTAGYSQPTLVKVTYIKAPEDGMQDYYLMAVPPDGPSAQVISQIVARDTLPSVPAWMKGVRVHGVGEGVKEALLPK